MSPLKKSDVKNHLSVRNRNGRRLHSTSSVADATGFSGAESERAEFAPAAGKSVGHAASPDRPALLTTARVGAAAKREQP